MPQFSLYAERYDNSISPILLLNVAGFALFFSWYIPANHGFWFPLDSGLFHFFNQALVKSDAFLWLVAITNNRAFDGISCWRWAV